MNEAGRARLVKRWPRKLRGPKKKKNAGKELFCRHSIKEA